MVSGVGGVAISYGLTVAPKNCDELQEMYDYFMANGEKLLVLNVATLPLFYIRMIIDPLLHMAVNPKIRNFIFCKRTHLKSVQPTTLHKSRHPSICEL